MSPTPQGSFRLFRFSGITVFLHWSWFVVGYLVFFENLLGSNLPPIWNALQYLSLFAIVLLHEFGHSLACRQVGGQAEQIILWPLGGVAYVAPPQRPGAVLWSIAAGPLVNVVLIPILLAVGLLTQAIGVPRLSDLGQFLNAIWMINLGLLVFNILPVYPLDGGQILRAILWFFIGPVRSLKVAVIIGFIGCAAFAAWALLDRSIWLGVLTAFIFSNCLSAWKYAQAMAAQERGEFPRA